MKIHKAHKFRIYPNQEQQTIINKTIGCCRYVFNHYLAKRKDFYRTENKTMNYNACSADLTKLKKDLLWLKEAESTALQSSLKDLDDAYSRFFRKQNQFPKFKSKRKSSQSYTSKMNIAIVDNKLKLPKLGLVKFAKSKEVNGKIISATVRRNPSGKYFVSILTETEAKKLPYIGNHIGLDLGTKYFAISSDGEFFENPKYLRKYEKQLIKVQRSLSRKQEKAKKENKKLNDCFNYQRNKAELARLHERITNCRNDYLQKLSTKLIRENQTISIEDLQVSNMIKNHNLAKSIADASWARFRTMLEYKANWYGRIIIAVDPKYTSQTCNSCGYVAKENRPNQATFKCVGCGHEDNADINAAKNIKKE
ncbi:IS200/IS605 family element RNA-guided endonuclease TnpB [Paenibacillus sp. JSM ZJ436]|uniref:IS200/IS605 family element RNA-guided endonuclease TnpB n=1 Tax=Paenibacillus sp. JSM ZJ436 TaxID=3376190 RepID=UPI0037B2D372